MNGLLESPTRLEIFQKRINRILRTCLDWLPFLQRPHIVHPATTHSSNDNFLVLSSQRRIHIIHIDAKRPRTSNSSLLTTRLHSLNNDQHNDNTKPRIDAFASNTADRAADEYWFTRWSRPLSISNNCNCSFRRCRKKSLQNQNQSSVPEIPFDAHYDKTKDTLQLAIKSNRNNARHSHVINSTLIEKFAEELVKRILDEQISLIFINNRNSLDNCYHSNTSTISNIQSKESNPCTSSASDDKAELGNLTETLNHDGKQIVNKINCKDSKYENIGYVNQAFITNSTDPTVTNNSNKSPRKACKHVKRVTKPLLYFLHGVGSSAEIWWNLLHYFVSAGYRVIAPDMLGHGFSAAPDQASAYTFQNLLKDAIDIFDRFVGEHGKCIIVGHAYGCSLAAALARYRNQVSLLVLISGGGPTPLAPTHQPSLCSCLHGCLKPFIMCGYKRDALYAPCGKHMVPCDALSDGMPNYVLNHVAQGQDWPEGDSTFHRRILVPTLLVHGLRDPHITLVQECEMERTIPRSFLELIPDAGHLAMLETPVELSHMIHCFIDWWTP